MELCLRKSRMVCFYFFERRELMNSTNSKKQVYVRVYRKYSRAHLVQMSIIFAFILASTLLSIWLPIYFARLPLAGG